MRVVGAVDGRCWDLLARSSGLLYPAWVLSAVRRGKQRQLVCWIQVRTTDGKVKLAKCVIDNGSEVNLVGKAFCRRTRRRCPRHLSSWRESADIALTVATERQNWRSDW